MRAYYNEIDPFAAQWLRNLIGAGHLPAGDVDERSIVNVRPDDLHGYTECHFFAGIGGWPYALRLAGWPPSRVVWTGSCPCQPFSVAGKREGHRDDRHLWPAWSDLIAECRPPIILGEQVASKDGRTWLAAVRVDLEGMGYAVGAAGLPACGVGAPHKRERLWFVAHAESLRQPERNMGDEAGAERLALEVQHIKQSDQGGGWPDIADAGPTRGVAEPQHAGPPRAGRDPQPESQEQQSGNGGREEGASPWADLLWLPCRDGKARPTQPGLFPLAHGIPNRVGTLRGAGNAIVPQVAAAFIQAVMECER